MGLRKSALEFNIRGLLQLVEKLSIDEGKEGVIRMFQLIENKVYEISVLIEQLENK